MIFSVENLKLKILSFFINSKIFSKKGIKIGKKSKVNKSLFCIISFWKLKIIIKKNIAKEYQINKYFEKIANIKYF